MKRSINNFLDLTESQRAVLECINAEPLLYETFYFTGGTALKALGIVPRISNDVDLFTFSHISSLVYTQRLTLFRTLLCDRFGSANIVETEHGFLHTGSGTIIDTVADTIRNIDAFFRYENISVASYKDMAAHKASALCSRDEVKDYVDLAFLTRDQQWLLKDLETFAEQKFGLGTISEEKLMTEFLAKREQFPLSPDMFLRTPSHYIALVEQQVAALLAQTTL